MAKSHKDDGSGKDSPTETRNANDDPTRGNDGPTRANGGPTSADGDGRSTGDDAPAEREGVGSMGRRTLLKSVGVAALGVGGAAAFSEGASAADFTADPSGEVVVSPGEYEWNGGLDIGSGDALVGDGSPGDVVVTLESGNFGGSVEGRLENIVFRGENQESKAGIDVYPGATLDGFVWPDGGQQSEDRALYSPTGGDERLTIRNSAWANMVNNGAYVDKPPVTMENCASVNNNIAGVRIGHRDGTSDGQTTYVRNCLIAVTDDIPNDDTNSPNARGLRLRHPANVVIENCWFVYLDVDGPADLIELHDGAAGASVEIRNCHFHNDTDGDLVRDKSDDNIEVTIENCTASGTGSRAVEPDYDGNGVTEEPSPAVPLPSAVTGYAAADDVSGIDAGSAPWSDAAVEGPTDDGDETDSSGEHTIVLHASPDNDGDVDPSFTVDGTVAFGAEAEPDGDTIVDNGDGTVTATSVGLDPDALDSYRFDGTVVDYDVPADAVVDVSLDGVTTSFAAIVEESGDGSSDGTDDGTTTDDGTDTDDGTTTDDGTDSTDDGSTTDDGTDTTDDGTDTTDGGSDTASLPNRVSVDGRGDDDVTRYTFTVSGSVGRDADASLVTDDGTPWDRMEDIAEEGKVIGLVGSGVDAYRFDGRITSVTVDGDATISVEHGV